MDCVCYFDSALIAAFEKTKKKYQGKLKKLEFQIQALTERYEAQVKGNNSVRLSTVRPVLSHICVIRFTVLSDTDGHLTNFYVSGNV